MVRIVQCLCGPQRHCILGFAYEPGTEVDGVVLTEEIAAPWFKGMVGTMLATRELNPWCHLCHSREWLYEDALSKFKTVEEAKPELERVQRENQRSRELIDELKSRAGRN